jgi:hypothetical protein
MMQINLKTNNHQEEKEMSLEYFYDKVLDASEFYESEYKDILDALNEAKKMYAEEIVKAFNKGYSGMMRALNLQLYNKITMLLPKKYISVSQINLWYSDRQKYINRYFLNLPEEPSIYMDFGKQFAEDTEAFIKNGIIMETFPDFYIDKIQSFKGLEAEKPISLVLMTFKSLVLLTRGTWQITGSLILKHQADLGQWTR